MGIVYVISNPVMSCIKIGQSSKNDLDKRLTDLYTTGVPMPFKCEYLAEVANEKFVETQLHKIFASFRINNKREFFDIDPQPVIEAIKLAEIKNLTPKTENYTEEENIEIEKIAKKQGTIDFEKLGVPDNAELIFTMDEKYKCYVKYPNFVVFNGEEQSLTSAAKKVLHELGYKWNAAQGPKYWSYDEETILQIKNKYIENM